VSLLVVGLALWVLGQWAFVIGHFVRWVRNHPLPAEAEQAE
jgi:hypothetical protein